MWFVNLVMISGSSFSWVETVMLVMVYLFLGTRTFHWMKFRGYVLLAGVYVIARLACGVIIPLRYFDCYGLSLLG